MTSRVVLGVRIFAFASSLLGETERRGMEWGRLLGRTCKISHFSIRRAVKEVIHGAQGTLGTRSGGPEEVLHRLQEFDKEA